MSTKNCGLKVMVIALGMVMGVAISANALMLDLTSTRFLGWIDDGIPASEDLEATYINVLIGMTAPSGPTLIGTETYTRTGNMNGFAFPVVSEEDNVRDESKVNTGSFGDGYTYLLAKYDGPNYGSVVWYVGGLSDGFELPTKLGWTEDRTFGISHWTLFNPRSVPDGGITVALLGLGVIGMAVMRRKLGA